MTEFNIGDKVYWARYQKETVKKDCPVCFNKLKVIVILGNGDKIKTPCDYCDVGFSGARGYIEVYKFVSSISTIIIDGKEINENPEGKIIKYRYDAWVLDNDAIFKTKKGAEKRLKDLIKNVINEEEKRFERNKNSTVMKLSWSVGYHQKKIRDAKKEIEYHSKKVELVKKIINNK